MKIIFIVLTGILLNTLAHDESKIRHFVKASKEPDRIFLSFHGNPATNRAVTWRTDTSIKQAIAQIAPAGPSPYWEEMTKTYQATTETFDPTAFKPNYKENVNFHSVIFKELKPDTLYLYRVGDGKKYWSEWIQFRTAKAGNEPFQFVYFGDAQNDVLSMWSRVIRMAYQTAPKASFAIHAGDLIDHAHLDAQWAEWFKAGGFIHAQWTGIPVLGNHEFMKVRGDGPREPSIQWRPQFTLPVETSLPESIHETVYTVDYQGMRIIVLNTLMQVDAQTKYIEDQLKDCDARWKVIACHYSIFSPGKGRDFRHGRTTWKPLLDKYGVDLVLQGHDHTYARGQIRVEAEKEESGAVYVTSVSGPKMYNLSETQLLSYAAEGYELKKMAEKKQFFQVIDVKDNTLVYKAYTADGQLYDQFTMTKDFNTGKRTVK
ncbi:MAG: fibronectin type III domain-containing protein [Lentisphaeria bacterium]|nr:fibronectin type III domain-containing protein [Lentisphaeria bacterium]